MYVVLGFGVQEAGKIGLLFSGMFFCAVFSGRKPSSRQKTQQKETAAGNYAGIDSDILIFSYSTYIDTDIRIRIGG